MYTSKSASSNSYVFYLYDIGNTPELKAAASPKRFVIPENEILTNCNLYQRVIIYLSPSQLNRLPESVKTNQLFMDYLKLSSWAIQTQDLPKDAPIEEKVEHVFDSKQAFHLLQNLAKQKYAPALRTLGACYKESVGVELNYEESLRLYRESAGQGYAPAQYYLGHMFEKGIGGVKQNFEEAAKYYKLAADQGYALGQESLAICLRKGQGVKQDLVESIRNYKLAADQGVATAQEHLAYCYWAGEGVPRNFEEAAKYYKLAADQGQPLAQHNFANLLEKGEGVPKDFDEAIKYHKLAADQGLELSKKRLKDLGVRDTKFSSFLSPFVEPILLSLTNEYQKKLDQALKEQADLFEEKLRAHNQQMLELIQKHEKLVKDLFEQKQAEAKCDYSERS